MLKDMLKILEEEEKAPEGGKSLALALEVRVGEQSLACPLFSPCRSLEAFAGEIESLKQELDGFVQAAEACFSHAPGLKDADGRLEGMSAEEIWSRLCEAPSDEAFAARFNDMEEPKRREVAEFVLAHCNVFSGRASLLSSRYDHATGLLD